VRQRARERRNAEEGKREYDSDDPRHGDYIVTRSHRPERPSYRRHLISASLALVPRLGDPWVGMADRQESGPVTFFKVFTFGPRDDVVVRLNDCIDESYALQVLAV
jgi:hypothetical protein